MHRSLAALVLAISNLASAAPEAHASTVDKTAVALVEQQLVQPLAAKENARSKFSRARQPAAARRVRVLDTAALHDTAGKAFVRFAVDEKHGWFDDDEDGDEGWMKDQITGCVYVDSREVFVQRGREIHPAAAKLGKRTKAADASVCHAETKVVSR
jgi:hypothetical protein